MPEVKAFVGHSFTDDDKDVVAAFTEYFEGLKKLDPNFGWTHARAAEPKLLRRKFCL